VSAAFPQMPDRRKIATLRPVAAQPDCRLRALPYEVADSQPLRLALKLTPFVLMWLATRPAPCSHVAAGRGSCGVWIIDTHPIGHAASIGQRRLRTENAPSDERGVRTLAGSIAVGLAAADQDEGVRSRRPSSSKMVATFESVEARIVSFTSSGPAAASPTAIEPGQRANAPLIRAGRFRAQTTLPD